MVNNGRNGSNRCAINETGHASGNSRKSSTQVTMVETPTCKSVAIEAKHAMIGASLAALRNHVPAMLHR